ncbi:MAG TPA: hypothetical protein VKY80_07000 [Croceibacterium sp.]|nr:hypothetical protein [Croceibacterium sp.]
MDAILSILVLAAVALIAAATWQWRRGNANRQTWLLLLLAIVMIANVLIWTIPDSSGTAPVSRAAEGPSR